MERVLFPTITVVSDPEPHSAELNMALDEVLLRKASGPLLRVYHWDVPSVSFGYFGKYEEIVSIWTGLPLVRRWTGGGVVVHGTDVTYTIIVPPGSGIQACAPVESYRLVHAAVATALESACGSLTLSPAAVSKVSEACFENPAMHDLMQGDRKIAGAGQRRTRFGLLHQGSLLAPREAVESPRFAEAIGGRVEHCELTQEVLELADTLAHEKYGVAAWLRRY